MSAMSMICGCIISMFKEGKNLISADIISHLWKYVLHHWPGKCHFLSEGTHLTVELISPPKFELLFCSVLFPDVFWYQRMLFSD